MPNHVTNMVLSSPEVIAQLLDEQDRPDFTQVCPYPETLVDNGRSINMTIESMVADARGSLKTLKERRQDFETCMKIAGRDATVGDLAEFDAMALSLMKSGFRHQRDWNLGIWSTKWNAYNHDDGRSGEDCLVFDTAWSAPDGVLRELSANNVETPILAMFADEDLGRNCGIYIYLGGNIIYDQCAEIDEWGVGKIQDRWNEFALELKKYDYDEEDMDELRQVSVMHKVFRDKKPIGRLTPQAMKLAGLENWERQCSGFLTSLFNSVCAGYTGVSINYNRGKVGIFSRDHETEKQSSGFMSSNSQYHEDKFVYVADRAIVELDETVIGEVFGELNNGVNYTTDMKLLQLLQYCGDEGKNLARILGVMVNFHTLVNALKDQHSVLYTKDGLTKVLEWVDENRSVEMNLELDLLRKFVAGDVSFAAWAEKAVLPKPSLIPSAVLEGTYFEDDSGCSGYRQVRSFKTMCMLYQYKDIMTCDMVSAKYTDSADGRAYTILHGKFKTMTHVGLTGGFSGL